MKRPLAGCLSATAALSLSVLLAVISPTTAQASVGQGAFIDGPVSQAATTQAATAQAATVQGPAQPDLLAALVYSAVHPDIDPPGANDWNCVPTPQHPRPVVLVHGT